MIAQNQQKVKREIIRIVNRSGKRLSVPERKFVLEMMTGMLATGQTNLTQIAAALTFMVRMKEVRDIWVKGQRRNIREVAEGVNRRVKFSSYARFGAVKAPLRVKSREYQVLFSGVKRMFLFRWKRRAKKALLQTYPPMFPFLNRPNCTCL